MPVPPSVTGLKLDYDGNVDRNCYAFRVQSDPANKRIIIFLAYVFGPGTVWASSCIQCIRRGCAYTLTADRITEVLALLALKPHLVSINHLKIACGPIAISFT